MTHDNLVGKRVISYDFADSDDCFVEGRVIGRQGYGRYIIEVLRWVVNGREAQNFTRYVYPSVNGRFALVEE